MEIKPATSFASANAALQADKQQKSTRQAQAQQNGIHLSSRPAEPQPAPDTPKIGRFINSHG